MELTEFLEKFLPNYYSRNDVAQLLDLDRWLSGEMELKEFIKKGFSPKEDDSLFNEFNRMQNKLFSEALQNFMNIYGKKQRENCLEAFQNSGCINLQEILIMNAKQPKIEEL